MFNTELRPDVAVMESRRVFRRGGQASDLHLVLQETHHRMMNTLTLLGASLRLDLEEFGAGGFPDAVNRFERRTVAFSKLHQLLSYYDDRDRLEVADYFEELCGALSVAILEPAGIRCQAIVGDGVLPAEVCHRLGLIITELVTNAAKHAFPDRQAGLVRIEGLYRDGAWRCRVMDNGIGGSSSPQGG
jgi:two-component sensor histidine kinase